MTLTEWDSQSHCMAMFAATALVEGAQPQSVLLVGPPGQGKSTLVKRFAKWPFAFGVSAISVAGLRDLLEQNKGFRLLAIDEFQRLFSMTRDAVQNVCGLLLSLLSGDASIEMVGPMNKGGRANLLGRRIACMAAIPTKVLQSRWQDIDATGLMSRFATLSVIRSTEERDRVRHNILYAKVDPGALNDLRPYPFPDTMPHIMTAVRQSKESARELEAWALATFKDADDRRFVMLVTLVQAIALLNGRTMATVHDVTELRQFEAFLTSVDFDGSITPRYVAPLKRAPSWVQ